MSRKFAAVLLIGLGTLLFLTNSGIVPQRFWSQLIALWPLLLVILGIRFALGQSQLSKIFSMAIILLAVSLAMILVFKKPQTIPTTRRVEPHSPREIYELDPFSERPYRIHIR
jgi:hypothetical protein